MSKINENTKMVDFPDVKLEKGETSTPVIENTAPQETHANTPTVKDVKDIVDSKGGSGSGDVVADNIFANDELEIGPSAGLGTNLREKVTPTRQVIATAGGLVVPTTAPTDKTLVGVGTGREQIQIYLGDGLELVGDTSPYILKASGGGGTKLYRHVVSADTFILYFISTESQPINLLTENKDIIIINGHSSGAQADYNAIWCANDSATIDVTNKSVYVEVYKRRSQSIGNVLFSGFTSDTVTEL